MRYFCQYDQSIGFLRAQPFLLMFHLFLVVFHVDSMLTTMRVTSTFYLRTKITFFPRVNNSVSLVQFLVDCGLFTGPRSFKSCQNLLKDVIQFLSELFFFCSASLDAVCGGKLLLRSASTPA